MKRVLGGKGVSRQIKHIVWAGECMAAGPSSVPTAAGGRGGRTGLAEVTAGPGSAPTGSPTARE